jgi:hypothetical protein
MAGMFPTTRPVSVVAGRVVVFGLASWRFFRWE